MPMCVEVRDRTARLDEERICWPKCGSRCTGISVGMRIFSCTIRNEIVKGEKESNYSVPSRLAEIDNKKKCARKQINSMNWTSGTFAWPLFGPRTRTASVARWERFW